MGHSTRQLSRGRRIRFWLFLCWLHICQAVDALPVLTPRAHWHGRDPMAPTPRMMAVVVYGMIGVSIVSLAYASNGFPVALYAPVAYVVYVAGLLGVKAARLNSVRTRR